MTTERFSPHTDIDTNTALAVVRQWFELYDDGTPESYGSTRYVELYAADADIQEMPTAIYPDGRRGGPTDELAAVADTNSRVRDRHVTVHEIVTEGAVAVARYTWSARIALDGLPWPAGTRIVSDVASLFEVRGGKIVRQVDYPTHFRGEAPEL